MSKQKAISEDTAKMNEISKTALDVKALDRKKIEQSCVLLQVELKKIGLDHEVGQLLDSYEHKGIMHAAINTIKQFVTVE